MKVKLCGCILAGSLTLLSFCGCNRPVTYDPKLAPAMVESEARYSKQYIIDLGDQLDILVRGHPELSRLASEGNPGVVVRSDGYLSMPLVDDVKAAGLTFPQLKAKLTERFSERLTNPEVTVIGVRLREPMVYVYGEVPNPRPVPLRLVTTAAQAIAYAGGLKHTGKNTAIALIRLTDEGHLRAYKIPVNSIRRSVPYMALQATVLQPDDILFVPESDIARFDRWVSEYINQPLQGANSVLTPITNFYVIKQLD